MAIGVEKTSLPGVLVVTPDVYPDPRGFFVETYQKERYEEAGITCTFVQDNHSRSSKDVLRGMHYQIERAQDKLVSVMKGEIYDVVVDVRRGSPTFGRWEGHLLSAENHRQLFVPVGLAHGFCVLSDVVDVTYKCSEIYYPAGERGVLWSDPDIGIEWPTEQPLLSERDQKNLRLKEIPEEDLPLFEGASDGE
jgi:dTDP-4-dehydrorhamnose 3,5-epimerase